LPAPAKAKLSALAVVSLVLGVLGCTGLGALAGLVCGLVALVRINRSGGRLRGRGLAIAGLVVSALMVPISAGMLLPALANAKSKAQTIASLNNLKQLGLGMHSYVAARKVFARGANFPPGLSGTAAGWQFPYTFLSAHAMVLPFIEQADLYNFVNKSTTSNLHHDGARFGLVPVNGFLCPSSNQTFQSGTLPGNQYAWSAGSNPTVAGYGGTYLPATGVQSEANILQTTNGMIVACKGTKINEVADGLSKTILAAEFLSGVGGDTYPFDAFAVSSITASNLNFMTEAELNSAGSSTPSSSSSEIGTRWSRCLPMQTILNTAAPPNWAQPTVGVGIGGWVNSFSNQIIPPRSMHDGGVNAVMADGAVVFIRNEVNLLLFQRLGHRSDGSAVDVNSL
jgi:prepilin-type processing-associated H-X9-DG protein